jgi:hypothetical protein
VENTLTSRIYGESIPGASFFAAGLSNGDYFSTQPLATGMPGVSANVGSYPITFRGAVASNPSGADYRIIYWPGAVEVTPRPVTVTAGAQSRTYGEANPTLTYTISPLGVGVGLVNGDSLSGALATTAGATSGVGSYAITQGDLAANSNYTLTYVGNNLAVTPRSVTVTADAQSRAYGDANPVLTYTTARNGGGVGLVNGDSLSGTMKTVAGATSDVGSYAINRGDLAADSNYTVTFVGSNLKVTPRLITVMADNQARDYGMANPALTYRITSGTLVNGDGMGGALTTNAGPLSEPGTYDISRGTLSIGSNYRISFGNGLLTIRPLSPSPELPRVPEKAVLNSPNGSSSQCLQSWSTHGLDARQPQVPLPLCGVGFSYVGLSPLGWTVSLVESSVGLLPVSWTRR